MGTLEAKKMSKSKSKERRRDVFCANTTHLVRFGLLLARPREEHGQVLLDLDLKMVHPKHGDLQVEGTSYTN